jgi:hypothetical protein
VSRGHNNKGGSNGHFNHADPWSTFLLSSLHGESFGFVTPTEGVILKTCPLPYIGGITLNISGLSVHTGLKKEVLCGL